MHRNPVKRGLVLDPDQWEWSSFRSYGYQEVGRVRINVWPEPVLKIRPAAKDLSGESRGRPTLCKVRKG